MSKVIMMLFLVGVLAEVDIPEGEHKIRKNNREDMETDGDSHVNAGIRKDAREVLDLHEEEGMMQTEEFHRDEMEWAEKNALMMAEEHAASMRRTNLKETVIPSAQKSIP